MQNFANQTGPTEKQELTYEFVVAFYLTVDAMQRNESISTSRLDVDWDPAVQCAGFQTFRDEISDKLPFGNDCYRIQPRWLESLGPPYVDGATITLVGNGSNASLEVPVEFFSNAVRLAKQNEVRRGNIKKTETVVYRITAFAKQNINNHAVADAFSVVSIEQPLKSSPASEGDYLSRSEASGKLADDFPVFIPRRVIDQAVNHMIAAGAAEVGGILVGQLHRDQETRTLFAVVTAQIFAHQAKSELTQLTFTAETWAEVDAAIKLRRRDEIWLGWWHTHPARQWCSKCPVENQKRCKLSGEFFSLQDELLHRTVFPQAPYAVALVISDSYASGITWPMFGWRRGVIESRGFYVLNE